MAFTDEDKSWLESKFTSLKVYFDKRMRDMEKRLLSAFAEACLLNKPPSN